MPVNGINPNAAIGAYQSVQRMAGGSGEVVSSSNSTGPLDAVTGTTQDTESVSFADLLGNKIQDSVETFKSSEDMSAKAINGEADITEVVQAVTEAELTLQTLVAVRDKMISAYQEIMRMQI